MEAMLCEMMRDSGKEFWVCGKCEAKNADLKSVIESIQTIKKDQDDQQEERVRVLEGLKVMERAVKKIEHLKNVQADHDGRLTVQETATKNNAVKIDDQLKRLATVEEKMAKMDKEAVNI